MRWQLQLLQPQYCALLMVLFVTVDVWRVT